MSHRIPKTAAVVATAATAAFAAYAVGSQTNSGGQAGAHGNGAMGYGPAGNGPGPGRPGDRDGHHGFGGGPDLSALAARLGVSETALKSALQSLRPSTADRAAKRDAELQKLADALGVSKDKLTAALAKVRPDRRFGPHRDGQGANDFAAALAKELGIDTAKVTAAFDKLRADHQAQEQAERDAFAQKLADKLGISVDKVKSAFAAGPFGHHGGPGFGPRMHR